MKTATLLGGQPSVGVASCFGPEARASETIPLMAIGLSLDGVLAVLGDVAAWAARD